MSKILQRIYSISFIGYSILLIKDILYTFISIYLYRYKYYIYINIYSIAFIEVICSLYRNESYYNFSFNKLMLSKENIEGDYYVMMISVCIALVTVLSAVGICERCRVESGGVYFLLSHVLGSRFGGSIGLLYCFGQVGTSKFILPFYQRFLESVCGFYFRRWVVL